MQCYYMIFTYLHACMDQYHSHKTTCYSTKNLNHAGIVAQSTREAEFIAATVAVNQVLWLRNILRDLHLEQNHNT